MKITDSQLKAFGLLEEGEEVYHPVWATQVRFLSEHVGLRKVAGDDGRLSIEIVIDSQTDKKDIPGVWAEIVTEMEEMVARQGHDLSDYFQEILHELAGGNYATLVENPEIPQDDPFRFQLVRRKPEYRDLFIDANFDLLVFLIRYSKKQENEDMAGLARHYFWNLLHNFHYPEPDFEELLNAALEDIFEGRCPWDIYYGTIDFEKFKNRLEHLRKRYTEASYNPASKKNILTVNRLFLIWGDFRDAQELIEKNYPSTYTRYKPRLDARIAEILQETTPSTE